MIRALLITLLLVLASSSMASAQEVDACSTTRPNRATGPTQAPLMDGMLGVARHACPQRELSLAGDAYLVAQPADFYGNIRIGGRLSGSYAVERNIEIWGSMELLRHQTILSAVSTQYVGLGYLSVGATGVYARGDGRIAALYSRLVLPTAIGLDRESQPLAMEVGTTGEWRIDSLLRLHAWLSALGSIGISTLAPPLPRGGLRLGGGLDWTPWEWLSIVVEVGSGFGYRDGLDMLSAQLGLRFAFDELVGIEFSAIYPFVGAEPGLAAAQLALSVRGN
jgi:hypothetical protein